MIKVTSILEHDLSVQLAANPGQRPRSVTIAGMVNGKPGVTELPYMDAVTLARLRWHYDRRPRNPIDPTSDYLEIGLLKFDVQEADEVA